MNSNQFHDLFGSQWPPDQHGGHSSASTMLHQSQGLPQGMQLKREPHTDGQQVMHNQMPMDITSGSVADSTSPPPGGNEGMYGSSMPGMYMDKKGPNSIRGIYYFFTKKKHWFQFEILIFYVDFRFDNTLIKLI